MCYEDAFNAQRDAPAVVLVDDGRASDGEEWPYELFSSSDDDDEPGCPVCGDPRFAAVRCGVCMDDVCVNCCAGIVGGVPCCVACRRIHP